MGWSFLGVVCLLSLAYGRWEERTAAAALVIDSTITVLFRDTRWIGPQWTEFSVDVAYLAILVFIALKSRRYWPMFAAGFQLLSIMTHTIRMVDPQVNGWTYVTAMIMWTYLIMYAILFGVWGSWKARRQLRAMAAGVATSEPGATLR